MEPRKTWPQEVIREVEELKKIRKCFYVQRRHAAELKTETRTGMAAVAEALKGLDAAIHELDWRYWQINRGDYRDE